MFNGKHLKQLRQDSALSIRELAEKAGVSPATIQRAENNQLQMRPSTIRKLAAALHIKVTDLTRGGK